MFLVSVASKGLRVLVSGLESTLAGISISVDSKWVRGSRTGLKTGHYMGSLIRASLAAEQTVGKGEAAYGHAVLRAKTGHGWLQKVRLGILIKSRQRCPRSKKGKPRGRRGGVLN